MLSHNFNQLCFYRLPPFTSSKFAGYEEVAPRLLDRCPEFPNYECPRGRLCKPGVGACLGADTPSLQELDLGFGCASVFQVALYSLQLWHNFHDGLHDCKVDRVPIGLDVIIRERALEDVIDIL